MEWSKRIIEKDLPLKKNDLIVITGAGGFIAGHLTLYFRHADSDVPQPRLALGGFARVHLTRGESTKVSVEVPAERLRYWDTEKKQYIVEPGEYEFLIGAASDDGRLKLPTAITSQ